MVDGMRIVQTAINCKPLDGVFMRDWREAARGRRGQRAWNTGMIVWSMEIRMQDDSNAEFGMRSAEWEIIGSGVKGHGFRVRIRVGSRGQDLAD